MIGETRVWTRTFYLYNFLSFTSVLFGIQMTANHLLLDEHDYVCIFGTILDLF